MLRGPEFFSFVLLTTMPLLARGQPVPVPESIRAENVPPIPSEPRQSKCSSSAGSCWVMGISPARRFHHDPGTPA